MSARPLLVTGATGTLGRATARIATLRGLLPHTTTRAELDLADPARMQETLAAVQPWAVVNTAGYVRVDQAEEEPERCFEQNTEGAAQLAAACATLALPFVTFSSDLVFAGEKETPYVESDAVGPLNVYGRSKAEAERRVLAAHPGALVVRTSAFFGPWDDYNFATVLLRELDEGRTFSAADDNTISPTYVPDLVNATLDLLVDGESGLWHLASGGALTWAEFGRLVARMAGRDPAHVHGQPAAAFGWPAPRPRYSVLGSERGALLPALDDALHRYLRERGLVSA